ncbi:MAG: preprotein translocase subunit SecE [Thermoguttaceae bacterium]|nr:preprotein translocase subunit SecE [Thermoguttaceae bacterium]
MNSFVQSLFQADFYKRSQGKKVRQGTAYALFIIFLVAAYKSTIMLRNVSWGNESIAYISGGLLVALGAWLAFRVVNWPRFADFLISVEAEMNKVSWPTRSELIRSSVVVLIVLFILAIALLIFDFFWTLLIRWGFMFLDWLFL